MRFDLVVNVFTLHAWRSQQLTVHGHGEAWRPCCIFVTLPTPISISFQRR